MKYLLFTTATCPKCPAMKNFVAESLKFEGETVDNSSPDFAERIQKLNVESAPTILIFDDTEKEIFRGSEAEELKEFLAKAN
ncbi:thioredoxin family protein [Patescibacteria group bacterium]|nr:thioredoxin family protein [Patescibacteria group bacterium]